MIAASHRLRIEAEGRWLDVGEDRGGSGERHRVRGRCEGERRDDDLVTGLHAARKQAEVQARGAGVDGHAGAAELEVFGELVLEGSHFWSLCEHAAAHHPVNGCAFVVADQWHGWLDKVIHPFPRLQCIRSELHS